jgi:hypothetical protein
VDAPAAEFAHHVVKPCCLLQVGFFAREQLKILLWRDGGIVAESVRFVIGVEGLSGFNVFLK